MLSTSPTIQLSKRINNMAESATLKMAALARELEAKGANVIKLSLGEPDFDTPDHINAAAKQAIDDGYTHYTPVSGYADLREAVCTKLKRDNNLDYKPNQIVVSTGAKQSIMNVVMCLVNPGEEVILPIPYWVSYDAMVYMAEGTTVPLATSINTDFKVTAEQLDAAITDKTKLIIFSSPCNPSGSVYTKEELKAMAEVIAKYDNLYVIADEIYEHITYTGKHESLAQFDFIKDRVITVNGLSKGFAMTGWRLGYIAAPQEIAAACNKMQGQFTSATCSITQRAAITALGDNLEATYKMKAAFAIRRDLILDLIKEIPGMRANIPQGAFYVFPDVSDYFGKQFEGNIMESADDIAMFILNDAHVAVVAGNDFGNKQCVRISYATSEKNLREAISRIKNSLSKLS